LWDSIEKYAELRRDDMKEIAMKRTIFPLLPEGSGIYLLYGCSGIRRIIFEIVASHLIAGGKVFWVDGANAFNPYALTEAAKRLGIDPRPLLKHLFVARAFTVYQLEALIARRLETALKGCPDGLGVIFDPITLCLDEDLSKGEAIRVLHKIASGIKTLRNRGYRSIVVCRERGYRIERGYYLMDILSREATRAITLLDRNGEIRPLKGIARASEEDTRV